MTKIQIVGSWLLLIGVTGLMMLLTMHQSAAADRPFTSIPSESAHAGQVAR